MITRPSGVSFGSQLFVYPKEASHLRQKITAPSLEEGNSRFSVQLLKSLLFGTTALLPDTVCSACLSSVCSQTLQEHVQECQGKEIHAWWSTAGFSCIVEASLRG